MNELEKKLDNLFTILRSLDSVAIGFSGGVDSSFLAAAAYRVLGAKAIAVTACSETLPRSEADEAAAVAKLIGIEHKLIASNEMENPAFIANDRLRCYYCKKVRFMALTDWAAAVGYRWVLEGSNADDLTDYRPGMKAVEELDNVRSPLLEAGLTKQDIRYLSRQWGLPTHNKLSSPCLATRLAYDLPITAARLAQVEAAEEVLSKVFTGQIRVRHHGDLARIEIQPEQMAAMTNPSTAAMVATELKKLGFTFVTLDLSGYQMGSMNQVLV